jgi:hypothetical protein
LAQFRPVGLEISATNKPDRTPVKIGIMTEENVFQPGDSKRISV